METRFPGAGVTGVCEPSHRGAQLNAGGLPGQQVFFPAAPSCCSMDIGFVTFIRDACKKTWFTESAFQVAMVPHVPTCSSFETFKAMPRLLSSHCFLRLGMRSVFIFCLDPVQLV